MEPAYLLTRIRSDIAHATGDLGIGVEILHDSVFLSGVVPCEERRRRIESLVRSLCGEYQIVNEISVRPPLPPGGSERL